MLRPIVVLLALSLSATTALATNWNGVGWYQAWRDAEGDYGGIEAGPFPDEATCKATLPANYHDHIFYCDYYAKPSDWDE